MEALRVAMKFGLWVVLVPLACFGSAMINAPSTMGGGPMSIDVFFPLGVLAASLAMLLLERAELHRAAYACAALALFAAAGREFHAFPPLEDGAFLLIRYAHDPEIENFWPAGASAHAIAFIPFEWALFLAIRSRDESEGTWTWFAARSIAGVASVGWGAFALERHADSLVASSHGDTAALAAVSAVALVAAAFGRRSQPALVVAIVGFTTLLGMLVCSSIYDSVV